MHNDSVGSYNFRFANDSNCSYLVLEFENEIVLFNHQTEIISQNPSSAFVPFHIRREDENISIYYNITSKIPLPQYLERKQLNKKELLDMLRSITRGLMLHSNYLLDLSGFILDKDFIYINPATAETSLVYIPAARDLDAIEAYKAFLKDLIVNSARVDGHAKDNYLQRILNCLKSEAFCLSEFNRLILDLRNSVGLNEPLAKSIHMHKEETVEEEAAAAGYASGVRSLAGIAFGGTDKNKRILSIVLLQLLIILAAAISWLLLISQSMGDMTSFVGILIIAAAVDMLVMNRIVKKSDKQAVQVDREINSSVGKSKQSAGKAAYRAAAKAPDLLKACDTTVFSEASPLEYPYLESVDAHIGERIVISKDKFIIGRLGSMVDYTVQGGTVGKLHAEITANDGVYYIRDLNSKNGTFINDIRIPSNSSCEVKNNDRVRFSNHVYVFRQQNLI